MNNAQFEDTALQPTYMSQAEANELMELWAKRQREEAARQALVTVHDVAEATQLSPQEIQRLLLELRSSRPSPRKVTPSTAESTEIPFWPAFLRVYPMTGLLTFLVTVILENQDNLWNHRLASQCLLWSLAMLVVFVYRKVTQAVAHKVRKEIQKSESRYSIDGFTRQ